jgi:hypothetical protein
VAAVARTYVSHDDFAASNWDDAVVACSDLAGRAGAKGFEIIETDHEATCRGRKTKTWHAVAHFLGAHITSAEHESAAAAAIELAEKMLRSAVCRCGQRTALTDGVPGCRWRLTGRKWEPSCGVAPVRVSGQRGDPAAIMEAGRRAARLHG